MEDIIDKKLLERKVTSIVGKKCIITIPATSSVSEAMKILAANRILSAPVVHNSQILGCVDMLDILCFVVKQFTSEEDGKVPMEDLLRYTCQVLGKDISDGPVEGSMWCLNIQKLEERSLQLTTETVNHCIGLSKRNSFVSIGTDGTLGDLIAKFESNVHRVFVLHNDSSLTSVISQSDIIQFLAKHIQSIGPISQKTVANIQQFHKEVVTVDIDTKAIDAFYLTYIVAVSAVAVVNKEGVLVTTISVSDLRGITETKLSSLCTPVLECLQNFDQGVPMPQTVTSSSTFETVILKLAKMRVHRLWIVNEQGKPVGVISLSDITSMLRQQCLNK